MASERDVRLMLIFDPNSKDSIEMMNSLNPEDSIEKIEVQKCSRFLPGIRATPAVGVLLWASDLQGVFSDVQAFANYLRGEAEIKAAAHEAQIYIPDAVAANQPDILLEPWNGDGKAYVKGILVKYEDKTYRCVNAHTSQSDWKPDVAPSLWVHLNYRDGIRVIPESISATAAFAKGERGWWNDILYESLADANVYTPQEYAANWKKAVIE